MPLTTRIEATCAGRLARLLAAIVISAAPVHAAAAGEATGPADCRIAFDMGSSGIRAGATDSERTARREFDALGVLWAGKGPAALAPASISALRELPNEAKFGSRCAAVGGGFSAWRLALQQDAKGLIETLARIHAESGVAVLVVPADREGAYGHYAARQLLGRRLTTTHVLTSAAAACRSPARNDRSPPRSGRNPGIACSANTCERHDRGALPTAADE